MWDSIWAGFGFAIGRSLADISIFIIVCIVSIIIAIWVNRD